MKIDMYNITLRPHYQRNRETFLASVEIVILSFSEIGYIALVSSIFLIYPF